MKTSGSISEIASALSKAQGQMTGAKKSCKNQFFESKYPDLSAVIEAISGPFAENGLSFIQSPGFDETKIVVTTRIMHSSGEWIEGECFLPPTKNDAQGYGSAITYAKRYGLQAMAGVPSVDDDGNDAVIHKADAPKKNSGISKRFKSASTLDELQALWGELDKDEHALYVKDKDAAKARIQEAA